MIPVGLITYGSLFANAAVEFFEMSNEDDDLSRDWVMGPFRRAVMGSFLLICAIIGTFIPFLNIMSSIFFAYWAVGDYYDYYYDTEQGPLPRYTRY